MLGFILFLAIIGVIGYFFYTQPVESTIWILRKWIGLMGFRKKSVQTSKGTISYYEGGMGKPLVLIHGFMGESTSWIRTLGTLKKKYRVLIPDLPGHGESSSPSGLNMDLLDAAMAEFIEKAPGQPKVYLAGHSLGGWVALRYAIRNPGKVTALVLEGSAGLKMKLNRNVLLPTNPDMVREKLKATFNPTKSYNWPAFVLNDIVNMNEPRFFELFDSLEQGYHVDTAIAQVKPPVLLLWGQNDGFFPLSYAEKMKASIPKAKLITFAGSAHTPHFTDPKRFANEMISFFSSYQ